MIGGLYTLNTLHLIKIMIGGMEKKAGGKMKGRWNDSKVKRGGGRSGGRGGMSKSQNFRSKPHVDGKF